MTYNNKLSKCVILFTGFNQRAVIAFLRSLAKNNVDCAIVAKSESDTIMLSKYRGSVCCVRRNNNLILSDILSIIEDIKKIKNADEYIIAPSTEGLNRFLLNNRASFGSEIIIPIVDKSLYEIISDKYSFSSLCRNMNFCVPSEYSTIDNTKIPFVAKPKKYLDDNGKTYSPVLIFSKSEEQKFYEDHNSEDFYFQEYVCGDSYYLLYYFLSNGCAIRYSQQNIAQQPQGKSIVAAVSSRVHKEMIADDYESLFHKLGYRGFVMIELRKTDKEYYMIEANPRFWGPSQLFIDAGVDLFSAFLYDYGIIDKLPNFNDFADEARYFWHGGIISAGSQNVIVYSDDFDIGNIDGWILDDVYRRKDTMQIYETEMNVK